MTNLTYSLAEMRERLASAESDLESSRECYEDYQRTMAKVERRYREDLDAVVRLRQQLAEMTPKETLI